MNNGKTFFDYDVGKTFAGFNFPGFDVDSLIAAQRKNFEAFTQANQLAVEGVQALVKRQVEIVTAAIEEASTALKELTVPGGAEEKLAKNTELAKASYEKALAASRELATLVTKTGDEAFGVLNRRFTESFDEIKNFAAKK
ncbi:MAG TPA: phasin family protein [Stellaceae bacterium]|nr:phasin family protein [Stellaceae bacterium]